MAKSAPQDVLRIAKRCAAAAEAERRNNVALADDLLDLAAAAIQETHRRYREAYGRAVTYENALAEVNRRLQLLADENVQLKADCRALEAIAGRSAPTVQHVESDSRGNIVRVTTRPLDESRRTAGFS
jgi:predicted metal-dependent hydrolase